MYKLPLLVLLIGSTVLCQAKPAENGAPTNSLRTTSEGNTHENAQSNSSHATDASAKEIHPVKDDHQATQEKKPSSSETTAQSTTGPTTGSPVHTEPTKNVTTTTTTTTTTTQKPTTTTVPPPITTPITTTKPTTPASTTSHSTSTSPTTQPPPSSTTNHPKPHPDGGFNLPSFLGGMILGLGLLAIGYVIFKFYQTRRDSSYRTL